MALRRYFIFLSIALAVVAGLAAVLPVVAGAGRGALALVFMGAAGAAVGAHAAPSKSPSEEPTRPLRDPYREVHEVEQEKAVREVTDVRTRIYSVRAGDYLAKIADEQRVSGGWKKLYADNRKAVGADPSLIRPNLKLVIGGKKTGTSDPSPSLSTSRPEPSSKESSRSKAFSKDSSGSAASTKEQGGTAVPKPSSPEPSSASKPSPKESPAPKHSVTKQAEQAPPTSETLDAAGGFTAPASNIPLGTGYKDGGSLWSSGHHTGVDFLAATGTTLKAVGAGTVVTAGWGGAYGNQVVIRLADGYYAQYAHLSSLSVSGGQTVIAGQRIGLSGATGNVTGPHLHFEIRTTPDYGTDVDPVAYLRTKGVTVG
ncbi:LysM peptidoglycan-binding domain-containing M23 family metallopeptidase [Streptomyces tendae]|uniref:LysM peptidoglycan-binding domain-containing M23 family metallopeptidase n=1 Tax=Streptomyces tendae TaxID=1932 RepID=UPI0036C13C1C